MEVDLGFAISEGGGESWPEAGEVGCEGCRAIHRISSSSMLFYKARGFEPSEGDVALVAGDFGSVLWVLEGE